MVASKVRVGIVGGGRTGTPLLQDFLDRPFIEVVGVADVDAESPGAKLARDNGVEFTTDALQLAARGDDVDLLIEVSGDASLKPKIKEAYVQQGNKHTIIAHDLVARLIISLVEGSDTLIDTYHPQDNGVG